jgi:N-acetylmuramoyl-L-alanine amidase
MRTINKIIIHCTATPEGRSHDVADITRWHLKRGFNTIGYHFLIHLDGTIETGRSIKKPGAHTSGQNQRSIGICYVGGMDKEMKKAKDTRTVKQKDSLILLMIQLMHKYNKDMTIHGHNQYANKACPSFDVSEYEKV